jgi:hypothetical protein
MMKAISSWSVLGTAVVLACLPLSAFSQTVRRNISLEAGTVIPVRLDTELRSNKSERGERFTATLKTEDREYVGLPAGTIVEGVVREAQARQGKEPGLLDLAFQRLRLPNGRTYPIDGSLIGLDSNSVSRESDGRLVAKPGRRNNRMAYAGYGAAGGLLASVLTGRGKIKIENVLLGAGIGFLLGSLERSPQEARDVHLKPGTEMGVRLDRRLTYAGYDGEGEEDYRYQDASDARRDSNRLERRRDGNRREGSRPAERVHQIGVLIDERDVRFQGNTRPVLSGEIVMLPVRQMIEALRGKFEFDEEQQEVHISGRQGDVHIGVGSRVAVVDGDRRVRLDAPVRRINDQLYAPMRFFELATGYKATWDARSRTVLFNSRSGEDE